MEKYAKCILLLNRIPAKSLRHEVSGALKLLATHGKFKITLSDVAAEFVERLESGAEFRYFEVSYWNRRHDIVRLDRAVSELRRYCQVLDHEFSTAQGKRNLLEPLLAMIESAREHRHRDTCISGGWLETIIRDRKHPAREPLLWKNLYFGLSRHKTVKLHGYEESANSPLSMHPEILDEVVKYVFLPARIVKEWRQELAKGAPDRDG